MTLLSPFTCKTCVTADCFIKPFAKQCCLPGVRGTKSVFSRRNLQHQYSYEMIYVCQISLFSLLAVDIYSKRIELRWEKKRITVKERESKRCFLLAHLKRQGDIFLSDCALTGQHSLEYFTTRQ